MRIGIAGPISLELLRPYVNAASLPKTYSFPLIALIAKGLVERGHEVDVFALSSEIEQPMWIPGDRLNVFIGRLRHRVRHRALDLFRAERRDLSEAMNRSRADVIHAHWTYEFALAALDTDRPTVVTAHDAPIQVLRMMPNAYRAIRLLMAVVVGRQAQVFTAVSPYVANHFAQMLRSRVRPVVVPNGLPQEIFERKNPDRRSREAAGTRFATVLTGWGKMKNGMMAIKAFAKVRRELPGATLTMFGPGHAVGEPAHVWAISQGLQEGIDFVGALAHDELIDRLSSSVDVFVHPSLEEAHPVSVVEAMALGVPIIAGQASGGVPWTLDEGVAGVLVDVTSADELSTAMVRLAKDPARQRELTREALQRAESQFHLNHTLDLYEAVYRDAISRAASR